MSSVSTSGPFWARYIEEQRANRAALAEQGLKALPRCKAAGCTQPQRPRTNAGRPSHYCVRHAVLGAIASPTSCAIRSGT